MGGEGNSKGGRGGRVERGKGYRIRMERREGSYDDMTPPLPPPPSLNPPLPGSMHKLSMTPLPTSMGSDFLSHRMLVWAITLALCVAGTALCDPGHSVLQALRCVTLAPLCVAGTALCDPGATLCCRHCAV